MDQGLRDVVMGHLLLIVCCVFYLIWWSISFRPEQSVNRVGGYRGVLLLITAVSGMAGLIISIFGINLISGTPKIPNLAICVAGIAAYIVLLLITWFGMKRPVTTELVLITGWTVLELCCINTCQAGGALTSAQSALMLIVIAVAFVISMVLYVLYYRMEEWRAFYAAMVPLITEAVAMVIFEIVLRI